MKNYRKYFKGPSSEIIRDILGLLILGGVIAIAATSPFFIQNILREFTKLKKYPNKKIYDTFYRLKEQGLIFFSEKNGQIYISLTKKGKQKAGWMQIDELKLKRPKKWDGKWRILLFDIAQLKKLYREALRGKLKDLGFQLFQKSAWITPFDCKEEVMLLKSFFGLDNEEIKLIISDDIGDDKELRNFFKLA